MFLLLFHESRNVRVFQPYGSLTRQRDHEDVFRAQITLSFYTGSRVPTSSVFYEREARGLTFHLQNVSSPHPVVGVALMGGEMTAVISANKRRANNENQQNLCVNFEDVTLRRTQASPTHDRTRSINDGEAMVLGACAGVMANNQAPNWNVDCSLWRKGALHRSDSTVMMINAVSLGLNLANNSPLNGTFGSACCRAYDEYVRMLDDRQTQSLS